jgi:glucokinase
MIGTTIRQQSRDDNVYGVGVDIGGTKILIHIASVEGNAVYKKKVSTSGDFEVIYNHIMDCLHSASVSLDQVAAIGFGLPGITDSKEGIVIDAPALQWSNVPFKEKMQQYFNNPVFVNNDVNCAALGERWIGSGRNVDDFVVVAIGTGVGSAIIANGTLIQGSSYMAGEIGYLVVEEDIPGNGANAFTDFGLFEKKISGAALSKHGYLPHVLFERYESGDEKAIRIVRRFVKDLSVGVANMVSLLNPQKVILGGGVSQSLPVVLDSIRLTVAGLTPVPTTIELSSLGEHAGAVGAAAYALEQMGVLQGRMGK